MSSTGVLVFVGPEGSFSYKLPEEDGFKGCEGDNNVIDLSHNSIMAGTLLGCIVIFIPISSYPIQPSPTIEEHQKEREDVEDRVRLIKVRSKVIEVETVKSRVEDDRNVGFGDEFSVTGRSFFPASDAVEEDDIEEDGGGLVGFDAEGDEVVLGLVVNMLKMVVGIVVRMMKLVWLVPLLRAKKKKKRGREEKRRRYLNGAFGGSRKGNKVQNTEEYEVLKPVQARLAVHPLTAPILGNNHSEFRSCENQGAKAV
ncbi:Sorting nexin-33 [Bienertia sinuspersici]